MEESTKYFQNRILKLIPLLSEMPKEPVSSKPDTKIKGFPKSIKIKKISNIKRSALEDFTGNTISIYKPLKGKTMGFNERNYVHLVSICEEIFYKIEYLNKYTTLKFIEDKIFDWIFDYVKEKKIIDPIQYLKEETEKEIKVYEFYFKLNAVGIEKNIEIGNGIILHIDKDFIELERVDTSLPDKEFYQAMDLIKDKIVLKLKFEGVIQRAEHDAKYEAKLIINSLRTFLVEESIHRYTQLPELEIFTSTGSFGHYLIKFPKKDFYVWNINTQRAEDKGGVPTYLSENKIKLFARLGFKRIHNFLIHRGNNDIDFIISNAINNAGNMAFTNNYYERIVKIISLFENIFLVKKTGRSKGLSIMKGNILPKLFEFEEELLKHVKSIFITYYGIRDSYLHNGKESKMNVQEYFKFQNTVVILIIKLIDLKFIENIYTYDELLEYFNMKTDQ